MPDPVPCGLISATVESCAGIYAAYLSAERKGEEVQVWQG